MRTTCHCVAHSEQVQKRVPCAPWLPRIAEATGAPPQAGQKPSPSGLSVAAGILIGGQYVAVMSHMQPPYFAFLIN
jgi:hypothetical protein